MSDEAAHTVTVELRAEELLVETETVSWPSSSCAVHW